MKLDLVTEKQMKWINIFYDTIYDYYCSGHNKVYKWELQKELKFLNYIKECGEYYGRDADRLNSITNLYQYIQNGKST
jgi:hypothetical protein